MSDDQAETIGLRCASACLIAHSISLWNTHTHTSELTRSAYMNHTCTGSVFLSHVWKIFCRRWIADDKKRTSQKRTLDDFHFKRLCLSESSQVQLQASVSVLTSTQKERRKEREAKKERNNNLLCLWKISSVLNKTDLIKYLKPFWYIKQHTGLCRSLFYYILFLQKK